MDAATLAKRLSETDSNDSARALLAAHPQLPGVSAECFSLLLRLMGSDAAKARHLAGLWRLLLRYGDDTALAYRAKGVAERLEGKWLLSAKSFLKAGREADNPRDQLSYSVGAIDSLVRGGRITEAIRLGKRLSAALEELGEHGLAARVKLNVGNAFVWQDKYREAAHWYSLATAGLHEHGFAVEAIYAEMGLSTSLLLSAPPMEARTQAIRARELASDAEMDHTVALCDLNIAQADLLLGKADEALRALLEARSKLESSAHDQARISEFLGDAYLRLNLWAEALDAYTEAVSRKGDLALLDLANCLLGQGQALMLAGSADRALQPLKRAGMLFRKAGNLAWLSSCQAWVARAELQLGKPVPAARRAEDAAELARKSKSPYHELEALFVRAEAEAALGIGSARLLARASRLVSQNGYVGQAWRVPALRASFATGSSRLKHYRQMFSAVIESRLLTASPTSRIAYLRDKGQHLTAYLGELLSHPTPARVREALAAVEQSRSAALIDEILLNSQASLAEQDLAKLQELRAELNSLESAGTKGDGARRGALDQQRLASLQRRWIETTHALVLDGRGAPQAGQATVLTRGGDTFYALRGERAIQLRGDARDMERRLKWLQFELLAPLAQKESCPSDAEQMLKSLASDLLAPWMEAGSCMKISPEGPLWQVPWAAAAVLLGKPQEPLLALHPSMTAAADEGTKLENVVLWVHEAADLYHAEQERDSFLKRYPGAKVCRTSAEARESLTNEIDLLHVISHARHNSANPMFSAILFGDGAIYATEIARSGFRANVVTLSACDTGNVAVALRDEPDGLARAFLARGARSVVGSSWPLDDEAAGLMFTTLHERFSSGASLVDSLAEARRKAREWRSHPYFWGSLALFGGYSR